MSKRTVSKTAPNVSDCVRVAIYTRVSTSEQVRSGLSLDAQVEKARAYCAFKGFTVVEVGLVADGHRARTGELDNVRAE